MPRVRKTQQFLAAFPRDPAITCTLAVFLKSRRTRGRTCATYWVADRIFFCGCIAIVALIIQTISHDLMPDQKNRVAVDRYLYCTEYASACLKHCVLLTPPINSSRHMHRERLVSAVSLFALSNEDRSVTK